MNDELRELARAVIEKYHLASLDDILREVPKTMCHVLQESDVFETWPADIVRLKFPEEHWDYYISRYEHFRDEVIRNLTPQDYLREMLGQDFALVTPGIRPEGTNADDQKRIVTPKQAMLDGSTHLVIGRPITKAAQPTEMLKSILASI